MHTLSVNVWGVRLLTLIICNFFVVWTDPFIVYVPNSFNEQFFGHAFYPINSRGFGIRAICTFSVLASAMLGGGSVVAAGKVCEQIRSK